MDSLVEHALASHNWELKRESGKVYYEKKKCPIPGISLSKGTFRTLGKPRDVSLRVLLKETTGFFSSGGYTTLNAIPVVNTIEEPLFIGAGLQTVLNGLSNNPASIGTQARFLAQPSLRVGAIEKVGKVEGYSSSFVNICTEQVGASLRDHINHLDKWFGLLSKQGIYLGHCKLVEDPEWTGGTFSGKSLLLYYGDLQIGDAVYAKGVIPGMGEVSISDIGLGLERVAWALNKTPKYYDVIGPFAEVRTKGVIAMDMVRSMTLMSLSGVEPSPKAQGYRFRQFVKRYIENSKENNPVSNIDTYSAFWSPLFTSVRQQEAARNQIVGEIHRARILALATAIETMPPASSVTFDDFLSTVSRRTPEGHLERYI